MEIAIENLPAGVAKVRLSGRFDTTGAVDVEMPFHKIITEHRRIIIDLGAVTFLSSYAVRVLLVAAKIVDDQGGQLVLLCPEGNVAKVLKTTRTDTLVPTFQTQDAAVTACVS